MTSAEEFIEFATIASPRLRRTAFLLCGDWHTAEDLTQTTLAKLFVSWRRISQLDAVQAYATPTLVNSYLAGQRRKRAAELLLSRLPERATNKAGRPVKVGKRSIAVAITPDGKTACVANIGSFGPGTVTPVATSTNRAEKPIRVGAAGPTALVIAR